MTIDQIKQEYNKYEQFPSISYNAIKYLMNNNELIWKLISDSSPDAYKSSNLTLEQKGNLIYAGIGDETNYRVFMDLGQDDSWTKETCTIRIAPIELSPTNYVYGNILLGIQIYCHYKINTMSNYMTRTNVISQQIIESFNGQEIGGLGRLYFDLKASGRTKMQIMGSIPFRGNALIFCNWMV